MDRFLTAIRAQGPLSLHYKDQGALEIYMIILLHYNTITIQGHSKPELYGLTALFNPMMNLDICGLLCWINYNQLTMLTLLVLRLYDQTTIKTRKASLNSCIFSLPPPTKLLDSSHKTEDSVLTNYIRLEYNGAKI